MTRVYLLRPARTKEPPAKYRRGDSPTVDNSTAERWIDQGRAILYTDLEGEPDPFVASVRDLK